MFQNKSNMSLKKYSIGAMIVASQLALFSSASYADGKNSFKLNRDHGGSVYVMSNDSHGNQIMVYARSRTGELFSLPHATTATGGKGGSANAPADPLGSQNSLVYDKKSKLLFAVNAGDNTISVLKSRKFKKKLRVTDLVSSGGDIPVSIAVDNDRVYVLNAGGTGVVTTFKLTSRNKLVQLSRIELGLSNATSIPFNNVFAPGQVGIDPLSRHLFVTHAGGQEILTADLDENGIPTGELESTQTPGAVPFSFATTKYGSLLVSEAATGSISSFDIPSQSNTLPLVSSSVVSNQAAACWILAHDNGFAYISNTASDNLSSYKYNRLGEVSLLEGVAGSTSTSPTDMTFAGGQSFIYSIDANAGVISGFSVNPKSGRLTLVESEEGLPAGQGIQGIASADFQFKY